MARILLAWEMGGGLGHTATLRSIARHPGMARHETILAVPWLLPAAELLRDDAIPVLQAPVLPPGVSHGLAGGRPFRAQDFADILAFHGYGEVGVLGPVLVAWRNLLDLVDPDLVIADHAPTLLLAARGRVPAIATGSGFALPPAHRASFPPLATSGSDSGREARIAEPDRIADIVAGLARDGLVGGPAPDALPGWFAAEARVPLVYPALDPYAGVRTEVGVGPAEPAAAFATGTKSDRIVAYLASDYPALPALLDMLADAALPVTLYVRGLTPGAAIGLRRYGFDLRDRPLDLAAELPRARLVLHHASLGLAQAALAAGRPQMVLPHDLEKAITARLLVEAGVAVASGYGAPEGFAAALDGALSGESAGRAEAVARDLAARSWPGADAVVAAADRLLRETGPPRRPG